MCDSSTFGVLFLCVIVRFHEGLWGAYEISGKVSSAQKTYNVGPLSDKFIYKS